ncbi:MAG: minor capsid protein [Clostridiales bacterium]|nr:minor capsid protein [Clostridiales bacterium]
MKNRDYWKSRFAQMEEEDYKKSQNFIKDMEEQFRIAQHNITIDIERWYRRLADNNDISLAAARQLLKRDELEEFHWSVEQYIEKGEDNVLNEYWMKQLENASAKVHILRLEAMKLQIQQHSELLYTKYHNGVTDHLNKSYADRFYRTAYEIQKGTGVGSNLAELDTRKIDKILTTPWATDGKNFSDRIWNNKDKMIKELHRELSQSIIRGEDPKKAIDSLSKTLNASKKNVGRLVMTEMAAVTSAAQKDCFKELDVEQFEIVATLDSITSKICQNMDGKHFKMSEWEVGVTAPPFHVWCRSVTVPYFEDNYGLVGERAARDEDGNTYYVSANMTYPEWKKSFADRESKTKLQEVKTILDQNNDVNYNTIRTVNELQSVAQEVKKSITNYADNKSKWSGKIHINNNLLNLNDALGQKEWNCDITLIDTADDGIVWHEMLHSCSISHYDIQTYIDNQLIEEASVEFLKQQICKEKQIKSISAYEELVIILQTLNSRFNYNTDMEFAKELFNIPLPERYQWLEDKVDNSLRNANATFEDYNEVMKYIESLKGGI